MKSEECKDIIFYTLMIMGVDFAELSSMTDHIAEGMEALPAASGVSDNEPIFLTQKEASAHLLARWNLNKTPTALNKLAKSEGTGPFFYVNNRKPMYTRYYLDMWAKEQFAGPTCLTSDFSVVPMVN